MLSRRSESSRIALVVLDQALLGAAFAVALQLRELIVPAAASSGAQAWTQLYLLSLPVIVLALWAGGLYRSGLEPVWPRFGGERESLWGALLAMLGLSFVELLLGTPGGPGTGRAVVWLFLPLAALALWLSRALLAVAVSNLGDDDRDLRLLIFGLSPRTLHVLERLRHARADRVHVLGIAADVAPAGCGPRLARAEALALMRQGQVDHVLVEAGTLRHQDVQEILALADREGLSVHITSAMFPATNLLPAWERIDGVPVLAFVSAELSLGARAAKRGFDLALSAVMLVLLAPALAAIALAIRLESPGPALLVQRRVGARGRIFPMLKFRTMRANAEAASGPVFASRDDPRCTPLGRVLRRTNVDELPQLLNVLAGHMSLVGPRPERPEFVEDLKRRIPRYAHKHWVRPGVTGWAQVHGLRGAATSLESRIEHDLYYIEHWSLLLDLRILVRTLFDGYLNAA